jgi:hypothetical protein
VAGPLDQHGVAGRRREHIAEVAAEAEVAVLREGFPALLPHDEEDPGVPGALAKAAEKLHRADLSVRYAYATAYRRSQKTAAVIAVPPADLERASRLFAGH